MKRLAVVFLLAPAGLTWGGEIVVVSPPSPMPPYQEALQGVCDALGACPPVIPVGRKVEIADDVRVVIALGGRAARLRYPSKALVITALAPGFEARREGPVVRVRLTYSAAEFARRLKRLQPSARRAVLLWSDPPSGRYARAVASEAASLGLEAEPLAVGDAEELPALLRSLKDVDAVWLAPDPGLVTAITFDTVREYARSRKAVFYAPAQGLAERGADPSLAPTFRGIGLRAGSAAREALAGEAPAEETYPDDLPADVKGATLVSTRTLADPAR